MGGGGESHSSDTKCGPLRLPLCLGPLPCARSRKPPPALSSQEHCSQESELSFFWPLQAPLLTIASSSTPQNFVTGRPRRQPDHTGRDPADGNSSPHFCLGWITARGWMRAPPFPIWSPFCCSKEVKAGSTAGRREQLLCRGKQQGRMHRVVCLWAPFMPPLICTHAHNVLTSPPVSPAAEQAAAIRPAGR